MTSLVAPLALFGIGLLLVAGTIRIAARVGLSRDRRSGPQQFHVHDVSRLGGIPIALSLGAWIATAGFTAMPAAEDVLLIGALIPALLAGLAEDFTHRIGAATRLLLTMVCAGFAWAMLGLQVTRLGPDAIDAMLGAVPVLSLMVTLLFVGGAAHALNIIDGYNGLAGSYVLLALAAILTVAQGVGDARVVMLASGALAATAAFFVFNFPYGRIFLGDGGSYLLGTVLGFLLVMLVHRNPGVSPWFAALLLVYPVWETLFSMYRKIVLRGQSAMQPDGMHLHMLVYKRLVRVNGVRTGRRKVLMNSATSLYFAIANLIVALFAIAFWDSTATLVMGFIAAIAAYMAIYGALVRFRAHWLSLRWIWTRRPGEPQTEAAYDNAL